MRDLPLPVFPPPGVAGALLWLAFLGIAPVREPSGAAEGKALQHLPLEILEKAFRTGDPEALRSLLKAEDKIYVASPSLGLKPGYYSNDQVYFLVEDLFRVRTTLKFHFLRGADPPADSPRISAVGRWIYRKGRSREVLTEIAFTLVRKGGTWSLREIRDLP